MQSRVWLLALILALPACAVTTDRDHVVVGQLPVALHPASTLVVVRSAIPEDVPDREGRAREAAEAVRATMRRLAGDAALVVIAAPSGQGDSDAAWMAEARRQGRDRVLMLTVDDFTNHLTIAFPILVATDSEIGLHMRLLDSATGRVLAEARRNRMVGGYYAARLHEDLPPQLDETMRSMLGLPKASAG